MGFPDYKIQEKKGVLRRKNRHNFVKTIKKVRYRQPNKIAIIMLFYSSIKNITTLLDYITKGKNKDTFDIIIINNSGLPENSTKLEKEALNNNLILLEPIANLGTDGGYAIGIEYAIENEYDYVCLVEDDITLLDEQTFSAIYDRQTCEEIAFINGGKNDPYIHSWYYQLASYPINFIKKCGNIDPRFFTRGGDGQRRPKIEKNIVMYGYKKMMIDKNYLHPTLKKGNGSSWWIYFVIRNYLFTLQKDPLSCKLIIYVFKSIFIYIRYGFSKLLLEKSTVILKIYVYALKDFLLQKRDLSTNLGRKQQLSSTKIPLPKNLKEFTVGTEKEIEKYTKNLYYNKMFSKQDLGKFTHSERIKNMFTSGIFISNFYGALYPIFILSKKIFSLDEFDFKDGTIKISYLENTLKYRYIKGLLGLIISMFIFIILAIIIYIKMFIKRLLP